MEATIGREFWVGRNKYRVSVRTTWYCGEVHKSMAKIVKIGEIVQKISGEDISIFQGAGR